MRKPFITTQSKCHNIGIPIQHWQLRDMLVGVQGEIQVNEEEDSREIEKIENSTVSEGNKDKIGNWKETKPMGTYSTLFFPRANSILYYQPHLYQKEAKNPKALLDNLGFYPISIDCNQEMVLAGGQKGQFALVKHKIFERQSKDPFDPNSIIISTTGSSINNSVKIVTFDRNNLNFLFCNNDNCCRIFNEEMRLIRELKHNWPVNYCAVSGEQNFLYEKNMDELFTDLKDREKFIRKTDKSTRYLVTVGDTPYFNLYSYRHSIDFISTCKLNTDGGFKIVWHPNDNNFAICTQDGWCYMWDVRKLNKEVMKTKNDVKSDHKSDDVSSIANKDVVGCDINSKSNVKPSSENENYSLQNFEENVDSSSQDVALVAHLTQYTTKKQNELSEDSISAGQSVVKNTEMDKTALNTKYVQNEKLNRIDFTRLDHPVSHFIVRPGRTVQISDQVTEESDEKCSDECAGDKNLDHLNRIISRDPPLKAHLNNKRNIKMENSRLDEDTKHQSNTITERNNVYSPVTFKSSQSGLKGAIRNVIFYGDMLIFSEHTDKIQLIDLKGKLDQGLFSSNELLRNSCDAQSRYGFNTFKDSAPTLVSKVNKFSGPVPVDHTLNYYPFLQTQTLTLANTQITGMTVLDNSLFVASGDGIYEWRMDGEYIKSWIF